MLLERFAHADAVVGDGELVAGIVAAAEDLLHIQRDAAAMAGVLDRIGQDVEQYLPQAGGVASTFSWSRSWTCTVNCWSRSTACWRITLSTCASCSAMRKGWMFRVALPLSILLMSRISLMRFSRCQLAVFNLSM